MHIFYGNSKYLKQYYGDGNIMEIPLIVAEISEYVS